MAGGVQTCQLTQIPLCGNDIMAIVVRQSVYYSDQWMPMCIPSYGRGNDDFMAILSPESSEVQDGFANLHRLDNMEALLDEVFVTGNRLPKNMKEERLRRVPVGLIYIDMEMWKALRPKIIKSLDSMDMMPQERAGEAWAASFMNAIQGQDKSNELYVSVDMEPPPFKGFKLDYAANKWGHVTKYSTVPDWIDSWSEMCTLFSLNAYFPIALKYARAAIAAPKGSIALDNLIKFFDGIETLMLLNKAFQVIRQDWAPKSMIQEYRISPLHDEVAKLVRRQYRVEAARRKEQGY